MERVKISILINQTILDQVSCGGHFVSKCSECDIDYADWCHGDCNLCDGSCVLISEQKCSIKTTIKPKTTVSTITTTTTPKSPTRKIPISIPGKGIYFSVRQVIEFLLLGSKL